MKAIFSSPVVWKECRAGLMLFPKVKADLPPIRKCMTAVSDGALSIRKWKNSTELKPWGKPLKTSPKSIRFPEKNRMLSLFILKIKPRRHRTAEDLLRKFHR